LNPSTPVTPFQLSKSCRNAWKQRSIVKVFKNAHKLAVHGCEPFSGQKCTRLQSQNFSEGDSPEPLQAPPVPALKTPISAWLASVSTIPVLRNNHWRRIPSVTRELIPFRTFEPARGRTPSSPRQIQLCLTPRQISIHSV